MSSTHQSDHAQSSGEDPADETAEPASRTTRFYDVCGSLDELKRALYEEPEAAADWPKALESLVEDALFMLARMERRLDEYGPFREEVAAMAAELQQIPGSRRPEALVEGPALVAFLRRGRQLSPDERAAAFARIEAIRSVANDLEQALYRHKALALALARAYRAVRGKRSWVLDESEAQEAAPLPDEPEWARWLPASPHRERILRYLRAGRAHLLPAGVDGQDVSARAPLVQFEDGGVMPLPAVRWSPEVRNFYPEGSPPHPRGLLYRRDESGQG